MTMQVKKYRREGRLEVRFRLVDPNDTYDIGEPVDKLAEQLAWGFGNIFGIKGEILNVE